MAIKPAIQLGYSQTRNVRNKAKASGPELYHFRNCNAFQDVSNVPRILIRYQSPRWERNGTLSEADDDEGSVTSHGRGD